MTILHSIILGIVEGITEFLPISSTGHMILTGLLLNLGESNFLKSFEIIIQLGAILAVVVLYWRSLWNWAMVKKLFVAFLPTAIIGLALYKIVKTYLLGSSIVVLWSLFLGGVFLIFFEWWYQKKNNEQALDSVTVEVNELENLSYSKAVALGFFQAVAIIPGVSRSASTIVGGLWLGLKRKTIVEFSFLLAVPTMLAATSLDVIKNYQVFSVDQWQNLSVGFATAFIVALIAIKFLLQFIRRHNFILFGVYRILVALIFWLVII